MRFEFLGRLRALPGALALFLLPLAASAVPVLQVGVPGSGCPLDCYGAYTTVGPDQETAFTTGSALYVGAAYGPNDDNIGGQFGAGKTWADMGVAAFGSHEAVLMATVSGSGSLKVNGQFSFLSGASLFPDNHYPTGAGTTHLYFDIGSFAKNANAVANFVDETGSATGEVKTLLLDISGFDWVHFDVMALVTSSTGNTNIKTTTDVANNAGSHDVTWNKPPCTGPNCGGGGGGGGGGGNVPEPASLLLVGMALAGASAARRRSGRS